MDRSELDITAELALLELTDDERGRLQMDIDRLLEYFLVMNRLDVSDLEPTTHALSEGNRLRPDRASTVNDLPDAILEQAPDLEDRFIAIPNVL